MARIVIQQGAVAAHIRQCGSPSTLRYIRRIRAVPSIGTNRAAIILTLTKIWSLGNIEFSVVIADPGPARWVEQPLTPFPFGGCGAGRR